MENLTVGEWGKLKEHKRAGSMVLSKVVKMGEAKGNKITESTVEA